MSKDYYKILGVSLDATQSDVKKAYKELALKHHPDRNPGSSESEAEFKRVSEAYRALLKIVEKRAKKAPGRSSGFSSLDSLLYKNNLSRDRRFSSYFEKGKSETESSVKVPLSISLEESVSGTKKTIPFSFKYFEKGVLKSGEKEVELKIPAGIMDGDIISAYVKDSNTNLLVKISISSSSNFYRKGLDVYSTIEVSMYDAILGGKITASTARSNVDIQIPAGIQPGTKMRLKGRGSPALNESIFGDHYVSINVKIPKNLSVEQMDLLRRIKKLDEK
jgi:DnaJ-class molecular chaperone